MKHVLSALLVLALVLLAGASNAETVLASSKTTLEGSTKNKRNNIDIAVGAIDATVIGDGGYFSFNDTVGPRSSSYGYKSAPNGRGVKVIGGGVAQVASTMYLALKKIDGISFDQRSTYTSFTENYVSNKKNAIMVDYKAGQDFSFYNETGQTIRIDVWSNDEYVYCSLAAIDDAQVGVNEVSIYVPDEQINNVSLACESIYDTSLENGDTFSFNNAVGPRTARCGYNKAANGTGADVIGGGVDMVASAVYMAVKNLDNVEILDKTVYRNYKKSYVSDKSDAINVDYADDIDFSFVYTGYGIFSIYPYLIDNTLYCDVEEY